MVDGQIKILRQIQHLLLIRDEEARVGTGEKGEELNDKTAALVATLDAEAATLYSRLLAKSRIFLAPISKGNCSACGLRLPTSTLQHVIAKDHFITCSSCGRILYAPEVKSTGLRTGVIDSKFLLSRYSSANLMIPDLKATTREEAIAEMCEHLASENVLPDAKAVIAAALEREKILTTAVGNGLAFPHMRGVEEGVLTFAAGVSKSGIPWGDEVVHLVIFTALPVVASPFYLKLLAAFATTFEDGGKLPFVMGAEDKKTLWKELNKAMRVAMRNLA